MIRPAAGWQLACNQLKAQSAGVEMKSQRGFSLIELLIVVAIILVIAAIAMPNLMRARMASNEAATVATLRSVNTAQVTYITVYPAVGYAASLTILGPPASGATADASAAGLLDNFIGCTTATCIKSGYIFEITPDTAIGLVTPGYVASAIPLRPGSSGVRGFCSTEDSVVHFDALAATSSYTDKAACRAMAVLK